MNPGHVCSRQFRLQFLRCESFKGKNAAKRLVFHFKKKEMLFGDGDVLGREVRLSDLSPLDLAMLQSGAMQVLPTRDVSGAFDEMCSFAGMGSMILAHRSIRQVAVSSVTFLATFRES
mmetsp:Transcript_20681/g.50801  ORF Transcript_20681/g.50801 Transcript_20681/m.50801 type:complete len:118 (+) Transcript_20681:3-356(+)